LGVLKNIKIIIQFLIFSGLITLNVLPAKAYSNVSFFVVAHQDDWQLFMGENAYNDIQNGENKVVIIYTTAGDAGRKTDTFPYITARQNGAINSVKYAANSNYLSYTPPVTEARWINGKSIEYYAFKNTVSYFLRIPDGDIGQPGLNALFTNSSNCGTISSTSTSYANWADLVNTLKAIYNYESSGISSKWLNCAETNPQVNPNDHNDHIKSSLAAQEAAKNLICNRNFFIEYYSAKLKSNISPEGLINKSALLTEYCASMNQAGYVTNSWDPFHKSFLDKVYFRTVTCNAPDPEIILEQNYPNPFTNNTKIIFEIPKDGFVTVKLYTRTGQLIRSYIQQELPLGRQSFEINRSELPLPGLYFCRLEALGKTRFIKLILE
jgi:hypothetical protein